MFILRYVLALFIGLMSSLLGRDKIKSKQPKPRVANEPDAGRTPRSPLVVNPVAKKAKRTIFSRKSKFEIERIEDAHAKRLRRRERRLREHTEQQLGLKRGSNPNSAVPHVDTDHS